MDTHGALLTDVLIAHDLEEQLSIPGRQVPKSCITSRAPSIAGPRGLLSISGHQGRQAVPISLLLSHTRAQASVCPWKVGSKRTICQRLEWRFWTSSGEASKAEAASRASAVQRRGSA